MHLFSVTVFISSAERNTKRKTPETGAYLLQASLLFSYKVCKIEVHNNNTNKKQTPHSGLTQNCTDSLFCGEFVNIRLLLIVRCSIIRVLV